MNRKFVTILSALLAVTLLLSACNLIAPQATATPDAKSAQATVDAAVTQAMQTLGAQMTSTSQAQPQPTATSAPSQMPTATATATVVILPTAIPPTATVPPLPTRTPKPTATATPAPYACQLVATSPTAGTKIKVGTDFDTTWQWKNTGTKTWEIGYVDLDYVSGQKMQTFGDVFDLKVAVAPGAQASMIVDMKAPSTAGKYSATWKLMMENITLCTMTVSIEAVP